MAVYLALEDESNEDGVAEIAYKDLMAKTGMSQSTVKRGLAALKVFDAVTVTTQTAANGSSLPSRYTLNGGR